MVVGRHLSTVALLIAVGMLAGRITGLLRELALAARYGLTRDADIAMLAISLPDLLNAIFIGGAVSAVLIPEYHRLSASAGVAAANQMACQLLTAVGAVSVLAALIIAAFSRSFVSVLAPGLEGAALDSGMAVMRIVAAALPCCALTAVISALLQARERVLSPAFSTVVFNSAVIVAILAIPAHNASLWLSAAVVLAAGIRLAAQCLECGWTKTLRGGWKEILRFHHLQGDYVRRYIQAFGAVGLTVFIPVIARAFASHVEGGIACFSYAYKLVELPLGLLSAVLTMAVFPKVSRLVHEQADHSAMPFLSSTLSMVVLATVPIVVFILGAAGPVVALLFQRGNLGSTQVQEIAHLSRIAFLALPALVLTTYSTSIFHALRDTRIPFAISLVFGAALVIVCRLLGAQMNGLMGAVTVIQWLNAVVLLVALRLGHGIRLGTPHAVWRYSLGTLVTIVLGLVSWSSRPVAHWSLSFAVVLIASGLTLCAWYLLLLPTLRPGPVGDGLSSNIAQDPPTAPELTRRIAA